MREVLRELPPGARRTSFGGLAAVDVGPVGAELPYLMVPGYTGSKEDFFPTMAALAAAGCRAIALDLPGQNETPGSECTARYSVEALAHEVLRAVAAVQAPVVLVGHSFGGLVSRRAALLDPTRLALLVLLSSGPSALRGPRADMLELARPVLLEGGVRALADAEAQLADLTGPPRDAVLRRFVHERFLRSHPSALLGMADALLGEPDRTHALRAVGLPVVVAFGDADDAWSPQEQAGMAAALDAVVEVLPGAAHSPAMEQPALTAAALLRARRGGAATSPRDDAAAS